MSAKLPPAEKAARKKASGAKYYQANAEHLKAQSRAWRAANPDAMKRQNREQKLRRYGLTVAQFADMLATQGGLCAICGQTPPNGASLQIDHAHDATQRVRALLCLVCNVRLDVFENVEWAAKARAYLEKH